MARLYIHFKQNLNNSQMKRFVFLLIPLFFLLSVKMMGQNPIPLTNGGFENWSTGSGYSISVSFFGFPVSVPVYNDYTYPTGWNYPTYPVNETINYSGMDVNVNTDLPLLVVSDETSGVPEGSHAIRMQSFMLSDIINPTVYNLAQSNLDSTLTASVFPTVLSTGVIDIDQLLPLMEDFTGNLDSLPQLMSVFSDVDLNALIDGGIPLNGENLGRMTGSYKYTSAVGGDNGGILMLGSKYNPATQRREVVGGGYTIELTDVSSYTPFEIAYTPLSEMDDTHPYVEADSVVILMFSSANTQPQQGSMLYLDNLQLWSAVPAIIDDTTGIGDTTAIDTTVVVIPDTCSAVFNLTVNSADTTNAELSWTYEGEPNHFEAEYGIQGFVQGEGTGITTNESTLSLEDLTPDTYYDVYVRCVCDSALWGEWSMVTFHTDTLPVIPEDTTVTEDTTVVDTTGIHIFTTESLKVYPNPAHGKCVVQFEQEVPGVVRLYAMNGALLLEAVPNKETLELTLPTNGIFLLVCQMKEGVVMRKIVNQGR